MSGLGFDLNTAFADATEFLDDVITDRSKKKKRLFVDSIERGSYPDGEGIVRKKHFFQTDKVDQSGLTNWSNVQISREAAGQDPGYDACNHEADTIYYSFEAKNYTGFETEKKTEDICLKDIKYKWQFKQQLKLIFSGLADATLSVWENFGREMYLKYCSEASNIYVATDGAGNTVPISVAYNPMVSTDITIPRAIDVSTLNFKYTSWWHQWLVLEAPMAAMGDQDGQPIFGMCIHPWDVDQAINADASIKEDFRYADSGVLISNYGSVKGYKGFGYIYDNEAPRFRVKKVTATTQVLERINPYTETSTTVGSKPVVNDEYLNAEYALAIIMLKDVYKVLVPTSGPGAPGGGTMFGVQPDYNGNFTWLNIQTDDNPYKEKGKYTARYTGFTEPMENWDRPIAFLYKRCPQVTASKCAPCEGGTAGARTITAATAIVETEYSETAALYRGVEITLDACLTCEAPAEIGVDYDGGTPFTADVTGVLVSDSEAPKYVIKFVNPLLYIDAGAIVAGTSKIQCS